MVAEVLLRLRLVAGPGSVATATPWAGVGGCCVIGTERPGDGKTASPRDAAVSASLRSAEEHDHDAAERDRVAAERDQDADDRDRDAELRERRSEVRARVAEVGPHIRRGALDRRHSTAELEEAALKRSSAAADRHDSALDRQLAAQDRADAAGERFSAARDDLTGLLRRGVGMLELQREIDRSRRSGEPLVVAFLDVDGLKRINDERGHAAGDEALRAVAESLRTRTRSYDVVMRYGGDEFLCAQPGLAMAVATERVLMVRAELSTAATPVFVSFGVAELQDDDSLETLVARADAALYEKRRRTRSAAWQPPSDHDLTL